jgi:hypothetical protein
MSYQLYETPFGAIELYCNGEFCGTELEAKKLLSVGKEGAGAFSVEVFEKAPPGHKVIARMDDGVPKRFDTVEEAYTYFGDFASSNFSAWNICYHLEDLI